MAHRWTGRRCSAALSGWTCPPTPSRAAVLAGSARHRDGRVGAGAVGGRASAPGCHCGHRRRGHHRAHRCAVPAGAALARRSRGPRHRAGTGSGVGRTGPAHGRPARLRPGRRDDAGGSSRPARRRLGATAARRRCRRRRRQAAHRALACGGRPVDPPRGRTPHGRGRSSGPDDGVAARRGEPGRPDVPLRPVAGPWLRVRSGVPGRTGGLAAR